VTEVDILVAGGGPAGLLTAAYLAERHRVALIERGTLGHTSKYWVTSERRLKEHRLGDCIKYKAPAMIVGTFLGGWAAARGDLAVVDEPLLLCVLIERCRARGVSLKEHATLVNLSWTIGFVAPADMLAGRQAEIHTARDRKLDQARQQRQLRRQKAA